MGATFCRVKPSILQTRSNNMLSRSTGQHKTSFQQLPLSFNSKVAKNLIIGIGIVSSLTAFLMILEFVGLNPDFKKMLDISSHSFTMGADTLTGFVKGLAGKLAQI